MPRWLLVLLIVLALVIVVVYLASTQLQAGS
jgi:hypothetical protein